MISGRRTRHVPSRAAREFRRLRLVRDCQHLASSCNELRPCARCVNIVRKRQGHLKLD
jgi:hypothetical protein